MGLAFADQIRSGENGKLIINQLVGNSSEALALSGLDQNTSYDFLDGQTPVQALQQIKEWKAAIRELTQNFEAAYPGLTEEEMASYAERKIIYGEVDAMHWVGSTASAKQPVISKADGRFPRHSPSSIFKFSWRPAVALTLASGRCLQRNKNDAHRLSDFDGFARSRSTGRFGR